jgi:glycosyltransferase involved in cell wall biosynthesis
VNSPPTVSVVMSVYNGERFLSEAVQSILGQSFSDFEFVIVDDGSTDKSSEILAQYMRRDDRIRVHRHTNKGRAVSLNIGIELSKGRYIARMDADDVALPNRLKEQVDFMELHPEVGLLSGSYERIDAKGQPLDTVRLLPRDEEIKVAMLVSNAMCHPAAMFRREVAMACGGYRKVFLDADDYDLWLRMSERIQLANLEQPILRYRVHSKQASIANSRHQMLCVLAARTGAVFRKQGRPDPFSGVEEITPELLGKLGVTKAEIQDCFQEVRTFRDGFRVYLWHPLLNVTRPIRHALGLRQKSAKATVKQKVLLRNGLPDATWVETGTFMGDTTNVLSKVAKMVYSIEPEPALFSKAEQRFSNISNVKIIKGLSEEVFPKLLPTLSGDICFWLDGHYSAGITFKGPQETPIVDELAAIGEHVRQMGRVVVMIDDVRCFDPRNPEYAAYPPVEFLVDWARRYNLTWHIERDIFIARNH